MTIKYTAYDTTLGKHLGQRINTKDITKAIIENNLKNASLGYLTGDPDIKQVFITDGDAVLGEMQSIEFPLIVKSPDKTAMLLNDIRYITKKRSSVPDDGSDLSGITNINELAYKIDLAVFTGAWINDSAAFNECGKFPIKMYGNLLSNALGNSLNLSPEDRLTVSLVAAHFYLTCFSDNVLSEKFVKFQLMSAFDVGTNVVNYAYEKFDKNVTDISGLMVNIIEAIDKHVRNADMNVLISSISKVWYGINSSKTMQIALEHPPTWMAVLRTVINNKSNKHSTVGRMASTREMNVLSKTFNTACDVLVKTNTLKEVKKIALN